MDVKTARKAKQDVQETREGTTSAASVRRAALHRKQPRRRESSLATQHPYQRVRVLISDHSVEPRRFHIM